MLVGYMWSLIVSSAEGLRQKFLSKCYGVVSLYSAPAHPSAYPKQRNLTVLSRSLADRRMFCESGHTGFGGAAQLR